MGSYGNGSIRSFLSKEQMGFAPTKITCLKYNTSQDLVDAKRNEVS